MLLALSAVCLGESDLACARPVRDQGQQQPKFAKNSGDCAEQNSVQDEVHDATSASGVEWLALKSQRDLPRSRAGACGPTTGTKKPGLTNWGAGLSVSDEIWARKYRAVDITLWITRSAALPAVRSQICRFGELNDHRRDCSTGKSRSADIRSSIGRGRRSAWRLPTIADQALTTSDVRRSRRCMCALAAVSYARP